MIQKSRERAFRNLLATFLRSDLSAHDIRELLAEMDSPSFFRDFRVLLRDVLDRLVEDRPTKQWISREKSPGPTRLHDRAYAAVQRKRLSKKAVIDLMEVTYPEIRHLIPGTELPVRDLLRAYFSTVPPNKADEFFDLLESKSGGEDPYLRGIIRRK